MDRDKVVQVALTHLGDLEAKSMRILREVVADGSPRHGDEAPAEKASSLFEGKALGKAVIRGDADIYLHSGGQYEWDNCAPAAVAIAAGLHVSRIDGAPLTYNNPRRRRRQAKGSWRPFTIEQIIITRMFQA